MFAGKPKLLLLGKGLHYGHGLALLFVRPDMQHLHAAPLSQGFQPHTLNVLPFAPFEQHGDGLAEVVVLDEIRGPNQQLPEPLVFWQLREVRGRFAPPQAFQLADGIVLQPGELAGHLDRERHAVEGPDAGGKQVSAGSALA